MDGTTLVTITRGKIHGVLTYKGLYFRKPFSPALSKANRILGIIKRTIDKLDEVLLPLIYKHQVRPHLEY